MIIWGGVVIVELRWWLGWNIIWCLSKLKCFVKGFVNCCVGIFIYVRIIFMFILMCLVWVCLIYCFIVFWSVWIGWLSCVRNSGCILILCGWFKNWRFSLCFWFVCYIFFKRKKFCYYFFLICLMLKKLVGKVWFVL